MVTHMTPDPLSTPAKCTVSPEWKLYGKRIFFDTDRERIDGMEGHIKGTDEQGFHMQGNDLVQRLRDRAYGSKIPDPLVEEAADEIERLRAALVAVAL